MTDVSPDWRRTVLGLIDQHKLKMKTVSLRAGLNETYLRDVLKRGRSPLMDNAVRIDRAIRQMIAEAEAGLANYPADVPIRGSAAGALLNGGLQGFSLEADRTVRRIYRPPAMIGEPRLYAFWVRENSMAPEHSDGDLRFAIEAGASLPGDTVVLRTRLHAGDPGQAYIKRLERVEKDRIVVSQHEGASGGARVHHAFLSKYVESVDRVLTIAELFGV